MTVKWRIVLTTELIALALLLLEACYIFADGESFHAIGYLAAAFSVLGSMLWNKFGFQNSMKKAKISQPNPATEPTEPPGSAHPVLRVHSNPKLKRTTNGERKGRE
ncbi:MAG: hypothetical protein KJ888_20885 [Gammaproteobacteria bacterium]|uniref:Uncharacterized protein n=1 Tax=viral metagenome TaxID=1070528 RepID=A0A6M3K946_9ZZZZ|nr:hypothetical protein [Gammaproteobacteria bacterium]